MKRANLNLLLSVLGLTATVGTSQAATISVDRTLNGNSGLVGGTVNQVGVGYNTGGIGDLSNVVLNDNVTGGRFLITVDDSEDTGAVFTAIISLSGKIGAAEAEGIRTSNGGNGRLFFRDDSLTREITFNVIDVTETTATGATIDFDGFKSFDMQTWQFASSVLNIDGVDYNGEDDGGELLLLDALAPSGVTADHSGFDTQIDGFTTQWTVTAIPEPSTTSLLGMVAVMACCRRSRR